MYSDHVLTQVARERHLDSIAQAQSHQLGRVTFLRRKLRRGQQMTISLRDGSEVTIRQATSNDAALLVDGFERLSPESRRSRFMGAKNMLSSSELRYLTEIDHFDHEAIGALSNFDGRGVGIARYVRSVEDPQAAEVAITVVDEWQRRGLGSELFGHLVVRARDAGICRFTALVMPSNVKVTRMLRSIDLDVQLVAGDHETMEYEIRLEPCGR